MGCGTLLPSSCRVYLEDLGNLQDEASRLVGGPNFYKHSHIGVNSPKDYIVSAVNCYIKDETLLVQLRCCKARPLPHAQHRAAVTLGVGVGADDARVLVFPVC